MPKLLVFNPEHDYALSSREGFYVAKARIRKLAEERDHLPMLWAEQEDFILRSNDTIVNYKGESLDISPDEVNNLIDGIEPWGWDKTICNRLSNLGFDKSLLPDEKDLDAIRTLSHRRLTIPLNKWLGYKDIPKEFFTVESALLFFQSEPGCIFKAPWSSSGRGIISTSTMKNKMVGEWLHGIIRRQGSVMAELFFPKSLDFATLWNCRKGEVEFRGVSVSKASNRGKYNGNISASQDQLENIINKHTNKLTTELINSQREFIRKHIAPDYNGRLGIDMMAGKDGELSPGVEINLRNTMGHVAMDWHSKLQMNKDEKPIPDPFGLLIQLDV